MGASLKGLVVIINFPFSDLSNSKRRPALIIGDWQSNDVILCQITSVAYKDQFSVQLSDNDFQSGGLQRESYIRTNKIFTADKRTFIGHLGYVSANKTEEVVNTIKALLDADSENIK